MLCPRCHREYPADETRCAQDGEELTSDPEIELVWFDPTPDAGTVYSKRYVVKGLLGAGAMARVYLAEDALTRKCVAIKVLDSVEARATEERERFLREARTIEAIAHPNIVHLLDAGQRRDGAPYLVMEYLYGETLGDLIRRQPQVDPRAALWIARQIASALAAAHAAGVIHRDVKPDNVFLVGEPGNFHAVKLVDFGLARLQGQSGLTAVGVTVGTLEYMAPEQTVKDPTGPRTDVYALGVVLYRMLTGELPFVGSDTEVLAQHLIAAPAPPSSHVPMLDPRLETIIQTAMRKLPRNRYPSMEDMLEDLERLLGQRTGNLAAGTTLEADVYRPQGAYAKNVASILYKKLGKEAPRWD
jgi:eukaryotic-like serine/threonine-protein kinase